MIIKTDRIHKNHPAQDFHDQEPEVSLNVIVGFTKVYQTCLINAITVVNTQTQLMTQSTIPEMHHTSL